MSNYSKNHVGEVWKTNEGYSIKILAGGSRKGYCLVEIGELHLELQYKHVKSGRIKYPLHPSVVGIGYIGIGAYNKKNSTNFYQIWRDMLRRCYDVARQEKQPTYKGVTVCTEWHSFQKFASWCYISNYQDGWQLDKDLLSEGAKIYSPETCLFIPRALNAFLARNKKSNTSGFTGVYFDKHIGKWRAELRVAGKRQYLGSFNNLQRAFFMVYNKMLIIHVVELKIKYKGVLPEKAIRNIK